MGVALYPTLVHQVAQGTLGDGLHDLFPALAGIGVEEREQGLFAGLAVQQLGIVVLQVDISAVDLFKDDAGFDFALGLGQGTSLNNLFHLETVAGIAPVVDEAQIGGSLAAGGIEAATGVRSVELAQQFAQQVGEVLVVVDVGQEFAVGFHIGLPVTAVVVEVVETLGNLLVHVVEHVLTLGKQVHLHVGLVVDACELVTGHGELLHPAAAQHKQRLAVLAGLDVGTTATHLVQQLGLVLTQVHLPQVIAFLEG